jgi:methionyl-tRNA synthetase
MARFYVTTPIYYVNDLPHIGHIYTTVVADTLARYRRLAGDDVRFLTGTDEHGQKIERAAKREGVRPIELADRVVARYHQLWRKLGISHDDFVRTTEARHERAVPAILERMTAAGDVYAARHEGWYCTGCETFYTEKELSQPGNLCPDHGAPTEWKSEENLFFRLSRYERALVELYDAHPDFVRPETRRNEVRSFVASGLKDLSISRFGLDWGVPFPGHPGHSVWVWLDALTNYVSALGFGGPEGERPLFDRYWTEGEVRLHLVGKDIVRFHAVFWPAFLLSAGLPLPTTVYAHGWWQRDGQKMSKSVGNVVRPDHLIERFGGDALRYFLLREMVFGQDASFSDEAFVDRFNADLANDLGNTASRLVTLSRSAFGGRTPPTACDDNRLIPLAREVAAGYREAMDQLAFQSALRALWRLLAEANQYLVEREPWKTIKTEGPTESLSRVLWNGLECVRIVATGLLPVLPAAAPRLLAAIGAGEPPSSLDALGWGGLATGRELPPLAPLFPRIDKEKYVTEITTGAAAPQPAASGAPGPASPEIDLQQFQATELVVGKVVACERVPKSEKLLLLRVDLGEPGGPRQLVAGIAKAYAPEALVGTEVIVVANLKPAKLMGLESRGMVLAASRDEGHPILLRPEQPGAAPGTRVK